VPADLGLSEREARVLKLLLEGKSNKLICRELDLAESTVKNHVTQILKALNVTSRTQAVIVAAQMGLVLERVASPGKPGSG
jgi:DNA-binding NarL/FixJ family response regulator